MKKILFLTIFTILLFGIWQTCFAVDLLLDYPDVPGAQKLEKTTDLPNLINYIYKFALLACGITAFVSILFGAIQYVTSAGDSSKAGDAKKRITDALWGILILLSAVLILRTINPDLVSLKFTLPATKTTTPTPSDTLKDYKCLCCCKYPATADCTPKDSPKGFKDCINTSELNAKTLCLGACGKKCDEEFYFNEPDAKTAHTKFLIELCK